MRLLVSMQLSILVLTFLIMLDVKYQRSIQKHLLYGTHAVESLSLVFVLFESQNHSVRDQAFVGGEGD